MKKLRHIFRRKKKPDPQSLRIDGVGEAPMTAEPDDAELAAQALLEMMTGNHTNDDGNPEPEQGSNGYYHKLAERIRAAHESSRLRTTRFIAFCEQELKNPHLPLTGSGSLGLLEAELFKRIDVIERYGGELKTRWQNCIANITVRKMKAGPAISDDDLNNNTEETTTQ